MTKQGYGSEAWVLRGKKQRGKKRRNLTLKKKKKRSEINRRYDTRRVTGRKGRQKVGNSAIGRPGENLIRKKNNAYEKSGGGG